MAMRKAQFKLQVLNWLGIIEKIVLHCHWALSKLKQNTIK